MDQRFNMPATHLEPAVFNRVNLSRYNTIVMVSGNYEALSKEKLKAWVQAGGTLVACEDAVTWCHEAGIVKLESKKPASAYDSVKVLNYAAKEQIDGAQRMNGAIFRASMDLTHPLCFGYSQPYVDLLKANSVFLQLPKNPFSSPIKYGNAPLQSGFITPQNYAALKNSATVVVQAVGNGRVIAMADNPNFRAFWLGGSKL
ncbi:MAG: zinc carboxypeptidase, partial [Bacteroidetes bacterium]